MKKILEPINVDFQFLVLEILPCLFVFNLSLFALSGSFGAIFGVVVRFKYLFVTYLCRQSTLVFDVQPYLFVFIPQHLGPLLYYFWGPSELFVGLLGLFFWSRSGSKNFGTFLCRQSTLVLEILPYLFVYKSAKFLALFGPFGAIFRVWIMFKNFLAPTFKTNNFSFASWLVLVGPTQHGKTTLVGGWVGLWLLNLNLKATQKVRQRPSISQFNSVQLH